MLTDSEESKRREQKGLGGLLIWISIAILVPVVILFLFTGNKPEEGIVSVTEGTVVNTPVVVYRSSDSTPPAVSEPTEAVSSEVEPAGYEPVSDHGLYDIDPTKAAKSGGEVSFSGYVDERLSSRNDVIIFASLGGDKGSVDRAYLSSPSGEQYTKYYFYDNGDEYFLCFSVDKPEAGQWTFTLQGTGEYGVCVFYAAQYSDFMRFYSKPYSEVNNEGRVLYPSTDDDEPSISVEEGSGVSPETEMIGEY